MSLYDGLDMDANGNDSDKTNPTNSVAASSIKFLQSQLVLKKAALQQSKLTMKPLSVTSAAPSSSSKSKFLTGPLTSSANTPGKGPAHESLAKPLYDHGTINKIENEYDPLYPNEYDKVKAIQNAEIATLAATNAVKINPFQATFSNTIGFRSHLSAPENAEAEDPEYDSGSSKGLGLPAASKRGAAVPPPLFQAAESATGNDGIVFAQKIMAKYGYKEGLGLGRQEQGISSALQVEKTGLRLGKIFQEPASPVFEPVQAFPAPAKPNIADLLKSQTKVLLLRNMVGPGEVDNDLEPEVKEECRKYGDVVSCMIYEMPGKPADETVRIFVEFAKTEHAVKAVVDMNGRFFGGRCVKAGFYSLDRFKKLQLAD